MKSISKMIVLILLILVKVSPDVHNQDSQEQGYLEKQDERLVHVAQSINERLSYMKDVAGYKWENKLPIEDKARESVVLTASQLSAFQNSLDSLTTRKFFEFQITLAKKIQHHWFSEWERSSTEPFGFLDLREVVRPELIRLGDEIIQNIGRARFEERSPKSVSDKKEIFIQLITTEGLSGKDKQDLFELVIAIKPFSN